MHAAVGVAVTKASPFGRGGSRKAVGEGIFDEFLIVTFGCVNKRFAVTMPRQIVKPSATLFSKNHLVTKNQGIYEDGC